MSKSRRSGGLDTSPSRPRSQGFGLSLGLTVRSLATGRDFLALELFDGQVRYVYDVGGGARTLRVNVRHSVSDDRWHQVAIVRSTLSQVTHAPSFTHRD